MSTSTNRELEDELRRLVASVYLPNKYVTTEDAPYFVDQLSKIIDSYVSEQVDKALDKLHYDIMDGHYRPPEGTTDKAFYYAQFHRIIDDNKIGQSPNPQEKESK